MRNNSLVPTYASILKYDGDYSGHVRVSRKISEGDSNYLRIV